MKAVMLVTTGVLVQTAGGDCRIILWALQLFHLERRSVGGCRETGSYQRHAHFLCIHVYLMKSLLIKGSNWYQIISWNKPKLMTKLGCENFLPTFSGVFGHAWAWFMSESTVLQDWKWHMLVGATFLLNLAMVACSPKFSVVQMATG